MPVSSRSPSRGLSFHSLHATSHALQPIQIEVSVKKPFRGGGVGQCASTLGSEGPDSWPINRTCRLVRCFASDSTLLGRFVVCGRRVDDLTRRIADPWLVGADRRT